MCSCAACHQMPPDPFNLAKHLDPATGIWPIHEWGKNCSRGFISDSRFGSGQVIKRTNRTATKKLYRKLERK